jgi:transcriptional regulator with XRE-family HTH domain
MNAVREARIQRGLSQKELARLAGFDARTLRKIESGEHVSDVSLAAVERVLGVAARSSPVAPADGRTTVWRFLKMATAVQVVPAAIWILWYALAAVEDFTRAVPLLVGATACFVFFGLLLGLIYRSDLPPNTRIDMGFDASHSDVLANPLSKVRSWLGKGDLDVGQVTADAGGYKMAVFGDFQLSEYPTIVERLSNFGVVATVSRVAY